MCVGGGGRLDRVLEEGGGAGKGDDETVSVA